MSSWCLKAKLFNTQLCSETIFIFFYFNREQTKNINVKDILSDIIAADTAQSKANDDLEVANKDRDDTNDRIQEVRLKLSNCFTVIISA